MARKKGPVLYELMRKDQTQSRWWQPKRDQAPGRQPPVIDKVGQSPAKDSAARPQASRMDDIDEDENALVFHLTKTSAAIIAGVAVMVLVVFAVIGLRAGKPATANRVADATNGQTLQPLAMLLPEPTVEPAPDSPVKVAPPAERQTGGTPGAPEDIEPPGPTVPLASPASLADADTRKVGLNYLVIQTIPDRPDAQEHAASIRKFLAGKGIRTIVVPGASGGLKVLSEQGFNFDDPADKAKLERLTEAVKKAGKEYATAKYAGRYDFRSPYPEKFKGR